MITLLITIFLNLYVICTAQTETLVVTKIAKRPPIGGKSSDYTGNQMRVHYTIETDPGPNYAKGDPEYPGCHMNIWKFGGGDPEQQSVFATKITDTYCDFNIDLATEGGNAEFVLALQDANDIDQVTTDIKVEIPVFYDNLDDVAMWVGTGGKDIALRIQDGSTSEFIYDGQTCKKQTGQDTCYYVGVTKETSNPISLCVTKTPTKSKAGLGVQGDITVCDETQTIADAGADNVFNKGAVPDEAEISYAKGGKADVTITRGTDEFELVVYTKTGEDIDDSSVTVCVTTTPCKVTRTTNDATYTIMMIGKATGTTVVKDSTVHTLDDYDLIGTGLSPTLLEIRWTKPAAYSKFNAHRNDGTADRSLRFVDTTVTCEEAPADKLSSDGVTHCFAYFTELDGTKKYDATITSLDETKAPLDTNKVTLRNTDMPDAVMGKGNSIELSSLNILWQKDHKEADISICFKHQDLSELSLFQVIFINKQGQSKRFHGAHMKAEDEACVSATNFDFGSFHLGDQVTVALVKRGQDGLSVLASDQTQVYFDELSGALSAENIIQIKNHRRQEILTKMKLSY